MGKYIICNDELYHHGVKGMRWGVRRKTSNRKKLTVRESAKSTTDDKNVARKALQRFIGHGNEWVANHHALYAAMEANRIASDTAMNAHRIATNAGLMNMSLGASMGTNPFMFGTM